MTPRELELMRSHIAEAVDTAVRPLRAEIEELKAATRKHSGMHRELGEGLRQSRSEISETITDTALALARRDDVVERIVDRMEAMERRSIAPAAVAAGQAETEARNAGIDVRLVKQDTERALKWWRHPALPVLIYGILDAAYRLANHGP